MKKRLLSMVLAMAMMLSVLTVGAGAQVIFDSDDYLVVATPEEGYYLATEYTTYYDYYNSEGYTKTTYTYDSNGNLIQEYSTDEAGYVSYVNYTYDEDGRLISKEDVECGDDWNYVVTYKYTYDEQGYLVYDWCYDEDEMIATGCRYTYDENGNVLTETYYYEWGGEEYSDGSVVYSYDENGNVLTEAYYYEEDDEDYLGGTKVYTYDENGNLIKCGWEDNSQYSVYTYNEANQILTEMNYFDGQVGEIVAYTYDDDGNATKITVADVLWDWDEDNCLIFEMTYDKNGNLTSCTRIYCGEKDYTSTYTYYTLEELASPFTDVRDSSKWYFNAVLWAAEEGITAGTSATTFSPNKACTRAQIVTFLWRMAGCPEPSSSATNPFTDVKSNTYYYKAVLWAVEQGITAGTTTTTFSPTRACTRAEAVTFLYRYAGSPEVGSTSKFTDVKSSAYYASAVAWAVENGITAGTSSTKFSPTTTCNRAMIVCFLYRYDSTL